MMNYKTTIHCGLAMLLICCAGLLVASDRVAAQETSKPKTRGVEKSGRDPFRKFEPVTKTKAATSMLTPPLIQERIERYRALKMAAANAHVK